MLAFLGSGPGFAVAAVAMLAVAAIGFGVLYGRKASQAEASRDEIDAVSVSNKVEDQVAKMSDQQVQQEQAKWSRPE